MSAPAALEAAWSAGIRIGVVGGKLSLTAKRKPPQTSRDLIKANKADIIEYLRQADDQTNEDWHAFYDERAAIIENDGGLTRKRAEARAREACITEWLDRNLNPSEPGSCAHCGQPEQVGAAVVPFGTRENTHTWLHPECRPVWHRGRRRTAEEYLTVIGVWDHE